MSLSDKLIQTIVLNRIADALTFALVLFENRLDSDDANIDSYYYPEELVYELTLHQNSITDYYLDQ